MKQPKKSSLPKIKSTFWKMSWKIKEENLPLIRTRSENMNKFWTVKKINSEPLKKSSSGETATSETSKKLWKSNEENPCWTKKESETLKSSLKTKSEKLVKTTKITWPFSEKAIWPKKKFKDSRQKWKEREDKQWLKNNTLTKSSEKWKNKMKNSDNKLNHSKATSKKIKSKPKNSKEKERNLKELSNKWEETVISKVKSWKRSEDSSKMKEETALQSKPLFWTFKRRTRDLMMKFKTLTIKSMRLITQLKPWLISLEKPTKSSIRLVVKTMGSNETWQQQRAELRKEPIMRAVPMCTQARQRSIALKWADWKMK